MEPEVDSDTSPLLRAHTESVSASKFPFCTFRVRIVVIVLIICLQLPLLYYYISTSEGNLYKYFNIHAKDIEHFEKTVAFPTFLNDNYSKIIFNGEETLTSRHEITTVSPQSKELAEPEAIGFTEKAHEILSQNSENSKIISMQLTTEAQTTTTPTTTTTTTTTTSTTTTTTTTSTTTTTTPTTTTTTPTTTTTTIPVVEEKKEANFYLPEVDKEKKEEILPNCPDEPPNLQGRLRITFDEPPKSFEDTFLNNPLLDKGGHAKPPDCTAKWKMAIIIPYRNRLEHLKYFVHYMHPILQRQQVDYQIFVVNQLGDGKFNRAKLMNVGFLEARKLYPFQCFSFHDVDLILEDDRSLYWCSDRPRHMSAGVDKFNYVLPYSSIFGGVTLLSTKQMEDINGFSNSFWGWGGEDDDVFNRLRLKGYKIIRYPMNIARYKMIVHKKEKGNEPNPKRFSLIQKTRETVDKDGINNIDYKVYSIEYYPTYTNITVDIKAP